MIITMIHPDWVRLETTHKALERQEKGEKRGQSDGREPYPLVPSLSSWIQFFSKVSQIIIVVEVKERNQVLHRRNHCFFPHSCRNERLLDE